MIDNLFSYGIHFGLLAMAGWGISDFIAALISRKVGSYKAFFWVMTWSFILLSVYAFVVKTQIVLSLPLVVISVVAGVLHTLGGLSFYKGLELGKISLVAPIGAAWSLITVLGGVLIFGEQLSKLQGAAILLIVSGTILVATDLKELLISWRSAFSNKGIPYALVALVAWGTGFLVLNQAIKQHGWLLPNLILFLIASLIVGGFLVNKKESLHLGKNSKVWIGSFIAGLLWVGAYIGYSLGIENYLSSIIAPLGAAFPIITIMLATILLHERLKTTQYFGVVVVVSGIILLST
jgi:transporter family protein